VIPERNPERWSDVPSWLFYRLLAGCGSQNESSVGITPNSAHGQAAKTFEFPVGNHPNTVAESLFFWEISIVFQRK
jgi:hypothetical protein